MLASAAVPSLFEAVEIDGQRYWDGLFSQNPPIHDLTIQPPDRKPDELWIIQINPRGRDGPVTSLEAIDSRRNELAGNISLDQELRAIEMVNEWVDAGYLPEEWFNHIEIRRIGLDRKYHYSRKLDRSAPFLREPIELGENRADTFFDSLDSP